jgi:rhamnogalacturonyl hydrolase YesR
MAGTLAVLLLVSHTLIAQQITAEKKTWVGDAPANAVPLATDLSSKLTKKDVARAMEKVADWQLARAQEGFDQDWTFATLYAGFMAVPEAANGKKYQDAMLAMGKKFQWQPGPRLAHADDHAVGQTYLELYSSYKDPAMITPTRDRMDAAMKLADDPERPLWWWCDALFMAPPVLAKLSKETGDRKYLDFMDHEWWITSKLLYSPQNHLYFRDSSYLDKHQANGASIYWSRGNGWVFAGLARVLAVMPADYPSRPKYVAQFKEMAQELASIQGNDGLWRPGLLDAGAYPLPENSGSAFYAYGFAWGINSGILDRKQYLPVVRRAWKGLLSHIYEDGRLGCIQPIGGSPDTFTPTSSYVFGTGAYLLAGSEIYRLAH